MDQHTSTPHCPLRSELLVRVLQHLDLKQRLGACALVCHSWAAAAAAATTDITLTIKNQPNKDAILLSLTERWLPKHGGPVMSLTVAWPKQRHSHAHMHLCLPFMQLQQLHTLCLKGVRLLDNGAAGSSSGAPAEAAPTAPAAAPLAQASAVCGPSAGSNGSTSNSPLAPLTNLTSLHLEDVDVSLSGGLQALSALTALRQLQLQLPYWGNSSEGAWLPSLACLQQLQELRVVGTTHMHDPPALVLSQLPLSLTVLVVSQGNIMQLSSSCKARLCQLTRLQHLMLGCVYAIQANPVGLSRTSCPAWWL